jgi:hypothetical protein
MERRSQAALVFNNDDERSLLGAHAERKGRWTGGDRKGGCGGVLTDVKNSRRLPSRLETIFWGSRHDYDRTGRETHP